MRVEDRSSLLTIKTIDFILTILIYSLPQKSFFARVGELFLKFFEKLPKLFAPRIAFEKKTVILINKILSIENEILYAGRAENRESGWD